MTRHAGDGDAAEPAARLGAVTSLAAFEAAADAFGGDLAAWPAERRVEAAAMLAPGAPDAEKAAEILALAVRLDALLERSAAALQAPSSQPIPSRLEERMLADAARTVSAEATPRGGIWAEFSRRAAEALRAMGAATRDFSVGAAAGLGMAAAAGLAVGFLGPVTSAQSGEIAIIETFDGEAPLDFLSLAPGPDEMHGDETEGDGV